MPDGTATLGMRDGVCRLATRHLRWCIGRDVFSLRVQLQMLGYQVQSVERPRR